MNNSNTYPEWPDGLGDPRVSAHGSHVPRTAINRHKVIAKFRDREDIATESKPTTVPKKRPHHRQFQGIEFPPNRCSFHFHCHGALATKHCHSCAKFDESQLGYYCDACFGARHPEYRLHHSWTAIKDATNQEEEWVAHITRHHLEQDAAELTLLLSDTQAFLARSPPPNKVLQLSSAEEDSTPQPLSSTSIDFKKTYTTVSRIYGTLQGLVEQIHEQLEQKPPLTREEALARIQSMWRIRKARKQLKALIRDVYASVEDPTTGKTYYYNKNTKETQWTKPVALGNEPLAESTVKKKKKTKVFFASREEEERQAASKLQAMARSHFARRHMRKLISSVYEKIWDVHTERFYYHNTKTKEVKWEKPRWVNDEDLLTPRTRYKLSLQKVLEEQPKQQSKPVKQRSEPLTSEEAACMLQRAYRRKTGFRNLLQMCRAVYERIYDPEQGLYYYHNTRTKETTWEKPLLLRGAEADVFTPRTRLNKVHEKRLLSQEEAVCMVQRAYRRKTGFRNLLRMCRAVYERIYDSEQGRYYYHNTRTKETTWEKPLLLRGAESDVFTPRTRQKKLQSLMNGTASRKPREWTEEEAATRLQGLYRAKRAKEELGMRLVQRFKRAVDPSSGQVYYVNLLTQDVSWEPPALILRSGVQIETFDTLGTAFDRQQ